MSRKACLPPIFWSLALLACDSGSLSRRTSERADRPAAAATVAVAAATASAPTPEPAAAKPHGDAIGWPSSIAWQDYTTGLAIARRDAKPVLILVYADWCSKCRALAPVFERPEIVKAASKLVMVRQNQDEPADWLQQYSDGQGNYVPRIYFLDAQGHPLSRVTSGHPRYPHFYPANQPAALLNSMTLALGG